MTKPITPREAVPESLENFPDAVIESFNDLIKQNLRNGQAVIMQRDVADMIASRLMISRNEVYNRNYLDVEPFYRQAGWIVIYDKPAYNESYEAHFTFRYIEDKGC